MDLIKIGETNGIDSVNARDLWEFLESKQEFSTWIKSRITNYGFEKCNDFTTVDKIVNRGNTALEYHLSLDMAKEISMVERNEKGKEARRYFIKCEKAAKNQIATLSPAEMMLRNAQIMVAQEKRMDSIEKELVLIKASSQTTNIDYFTVSGYCSLKNIKATPSKVNAYGRKCAKYSREYDYPIEKIKDSKYGQVNSYHIDVLSENLP